MKHSALDGRRNNVAFQLRFVDNRTSKRFPRKPRMANPSSRPATVSTRGGELTRGLFTGAADVANWSQNNRFPLTNEWSLWCGERRETFACSVNSQFT